MRKQKAFFKAKWLANLFKSDYCLVKYFYGYDAEPFSAAIPKDEIIKYVCATLTIT